MEGVVFQPDGEKTVQRPAMREQLLGRQRSAVAEHVVGEDQ